MVASKSYNANDLIFQYSKWTCPCWIWIQHHFGSSGFNRNVLNAKITTSKRGFLFVLIMPVQQVQEQKALILKTRKTWISFPIKKKHSPDSLCVLTLQYCNFTFSAHSWHTWLTNEKLNHYTWPTPLITSVRLPRLFDLVLRTCWTRRSASFLPELRDSSRERDGGGGGSVIGQLGEGGVFS